MELRPQLLASRKQSLAITSSVIQSIKLLKYGQEELNAFLREQEEKNAFIEIVSGSADALPGDVSAPERRAEAGLSDSVSANGHPGRTMPRASRASGRSSDEALRTIEGTFASPTSLREHLLRQVELTFSDRRPQIVAIEIVESIEPDGYLRRDLDEIADCLGVEFSKVEAVLKQVQGFEPCGIGARNLAECLSLQLAAKGQLTPSMSMLLDNIDLLAKYDFERLAEICNVGRDHIAEMVETIRELDPRPGRCYENEPVISALPDVNVHVGRDGTFHVELNADLLPRVLVNHDYYSAIRDGPNGANATRFVADCMSKANWLTRNLEQRANTILKVATEIVKRQKNFFRHGAEHFSPLCQGDVAEALGIHRSTVCRAISNKYMMTNRGMFELKFFFSNAFQNPEGEEQASAESVRAKIRQMIETETVCAVMSDDAIRTALRRDGIAIARRTVAKYREMMDIPSSSVRKRRHRAGQVEKHLCPA